MPTARDPSDRDPIAPRPQPLRADAARNRDLILAAARELYASQGVNASMAAIARRAGVGLATAFRRFPTRECLIASVFSDRMEGYADAVAAALDEADAWAGFTGFVETACAMQAADRGFADVLTMSFPTAKAFEDKRARTYEGFKLLIDRAKAAGRLQPDFSPEDLIVLLMANAGVISATGDTAPDTWRRLVGQMLRAFAVPQDDRPPDALPVAPRPEAMFRAMVRLAEDR